MMTMINAQCLPEFPILNWKRDFLYATLNIYMNIFCNWNVLAIMSVMIVGVRVYICLFLTY